MGLSRNAIQSGFSIVAVCWGASVAAKELPVTRIVASPTPVEVMILLDQDGRIVPPYLVEFAGGTVMNSIRMDLPSRSLKSGEVMEFGDRFRLMPRLAFQVWSKERFLWVGGGVFQGALYGPKIKRTESPYGLKLDRGWIRVWVDEKSETPARIETPNGSFLAHQAEFWMLVHDGETEIYLISGEVVGPTGSKHGVGEPGTLVATLPRAESSNPFDEENEIEDEGFRYYHWKQGETQPTIGALWTPSQIEYKVKSVYPELMKLVKKAQEDWESDRGEKIFKELRKGGWRRSSGLGDKK